MSKPEADLEAAAAKEPAPAAAEAPRKVVAEDPALRWAFVRKVYCILAVQFAFTAAVAVAACSVRPIPRFMRTRSAAAWGVYLSVLISPFLVMWPMLKYKEKHPVNLVLLGLFTLCVSLSVGMATIGVGGRAVLQSAVLTAAAVIALTLFTFWAAKRGYDFAFLFPFLFVCLIVLLLYIVIQLCFPLGRIGMTIYGCVATIVFSGFIIYDTNQLIKRHTYNEYIHAAISLYLDVINLFMAQLSLSAVH